MKWIESMLAGFLAFLCHNFGVTPDTLRQNRRGNLPPEPVGTQTVYRFR